MRISDWSSDVCSADLLEAVVRRFDRCDEVTVSPEGLSAWVECFRVLQAAEVWGNHGAWIRQVKPALGRGIRERLEWARSEERRVGQECVRSGRSRWWPHSEKKKSKYIWRCQKT